MQHSDLLLLAVIAIKLIMVKLSFYILNILKSNQKELKVVLSFISFTFITVFNYDYQNSLQLARIFLTSY